MHNSGMRSHSQIVRDITPPKIADLTGSSIHTVRSWAQRDSIPSDHWLVLVSEGLCTGDELMRAAARDKAA